MDRLGSYRLRKRLASGGMGEVYLGEKVGPEGFVKPVVLKCVLPQLATDRAFVQLFLDEARVAALLNHPNIAQVYDFGLVDDVYFIAMEYVPGYTVDDIRRKLRSIHQFMPVQHVACIASQVCQGLHHAHALSDGNGLSLGLVHRDISPQNLIVSIDGSVKIVDFGIAKARAGLTRVQAKGAVGKFGYMSPEQSRGEAVDGRSDAFSLGVCMWELITNERLHNPKLDRLPDYSSARPLRAVEELRAEVPEAFLSILDAALAIDPEDRHANAHEMHLALERFQVSMAHYAGQAALAQFLKDLAEGRVENQETAAGAERSVSVRATSGRVSPLGGGRETPRKSQATIDRQAEVSSSNSANSSFRGMSAVPTAPSQPLVAVRRQGPRSNGAQLIELPEARADSKSTDPIELAAAVHAPTTATRAPARHPPRQAKFSVSFLAFSVLVGGGGYAAYAYRARLVELARPVVIDPAPPSAPTSICTYRVESEPAGALLTLDDKVVGRTPQSLELLPDVQYQLAVSLPGRATHHQTMTARSSTAVRRLRFALEPAATLELVTVPTGAKVFVNGRSIVGKVTPMTLDDVPADRPLQLRFERIGVPLAFRTVQLPAGKRKRLVVELDPQ